MRRSHRASELKSSRSPLQALRHHLVMERLEERSLLAIASWSEMQGLLPVLENFKSFSVAAASDQLMESQPQELLDLLQPPGGSGSESGSVTTDDGSDEGDDDSWESEEVPEAPADLNRGEGGDRIPPFESQQVTDAGQPGSMPPQSGLVRPKNPGPQDLPADNPETLPPAPDRVRPPADQGIMPPNVPPSPPPSGLGNGELPPQGTGERLPPALLPPQTRSMEEGKAESIRDSVVRSSTRDEEDATRLPRLLLPKVEGLGQFLRQVDSAVLSRAVESSREIPFGELANETRLLTLESRLEPHGASASPSSDTLLPEHRVAVSLPAGSRASLDRLWNSVSGVEGGITQPRQAVPALAGPDQASAAVAPPAATPLTTAARAVLHWLAAETGNNENPFAVGHTVPAHSPEAVLAVATAESHSPGSGAAHARDTEPTWENFAASFATAPVTAVTGGGSRGSSGPMLDENHDNWGLLFAPALFAFGVPKRYQATILLVDHDETTRDPLHMLLAEEGYLVLAAGSAHDAWGVLRAPLAPIDLILLDPHLPDVSGMMLYARLQELYPELPVVICSHDELEPSELAAFRALGAPYYLRKPVAGEKLLATVQAVLS